jgi:NAD-reducing hydrogenase large subunit
MTQRIVIDPVTRIEGHARISIFVDEDGQVKDAWFHVAEFRGFEKFCEGRPFTEMAGITARVCGICPVSHLIASVKAGDEIMAVRIPPAAEKLRRLLNLAQIVQSHALSFFHLSAPDLLLGFDSDPAARNVFGLAKANPDLARGGIRLRQFGQQIIEALGGKKIHPAWVAPGGVRGSLTPEQRDHIRNGLPEAFATTTTALGILKGLLDKYRDEISIFGNFSTLFLGLCADDGTWEHYGGSIRIVDSRGKIVANKLDPHRYMDFIGEAVEPYSYLKSPYYKPLGYPDGIYRVGPPAVVRLHGGAAGGCGVGGVSQTRARRNQLLVLLPLRPLDRDPGRAGTHRTAGQRSGPAVC